MVKISSVKALLAKNSPLRTELHHKDPDCGKSYSSNAILQLQFIYFRIVML